MTAPPDVILASTSPYRRKLLERLGIPFRGIAPEFHEDLYKNRGEDPLTLARTLAAGKSWNVAQKEPRALVIGSDQVATINGHILDKPGTARRAADQLAMLSGKTHELITAVCIVHEGRDIVFHDIARLTMRPLSRAELERSIARDSPLDCAGSYKIESSGIALFERIETDDFTAITGLPMIETVSVLRDLGIPIP